MFTIRKLLNLTKSTCAAKLSASLSTSLKRTVFWVFIIVVVIIIIGLSPSIADFFTDKREIFFQRSGSLIVAVFVFTEFRLYRHIARFDRLLSTSEHITLKGEKVAPNKVLHLSEEFLEDTKYNRRFLISLGLIGTVIWGYGDLIYLFMV